MLPDQNVKSGANEGKIFTYLKQKHPLSKCFMMQLIQAVVEALGSVFLNQLKVLFASADKSWKMLEMF